MNKKLLYFLIIAGFLLLILNLWSADFERAKINFFSAGASILMVVYGILKLTKKQKNEN